jgi:hypothetical protein
MIDAYTIGISLALEDGVSEGIAAIRRDLAALDTAIAASAAQLSMLRRLAAELPLPYQGRETVRDASLVTRPAPEKQTAQRPVAATEAAAVAMSPAQFSAPASRPPTDVAPPAAEVLPTSSTAAAAAVPLPSPAIKYPAVPLLPVSAPSVVMAPPVLQPGPPVPPAIPTSVVQPASAAPTGTPVANVQPDPVAQIAAPAPPVAAAPVRAPNVPQPPPLQAARTGGDVPLDFAAIARALAPPVSAPTTATIQQPERPPATPASPAGQSPIIMAAAPTEPSPRYIPPGTDASSPPTLAPIPLPARSDAPGRAPGPRKPAAPVISVHVPHATSSVPTSEPTRPLPATDLDGAQQTDRPASAELHLDGAALGRWVTRHLERQVTRPQAGATGFDPRMTPSWSGAPIGN